MTIMVDKNLIKDTRISISVSGSDFAELEHILDEIIKSAQFKRCYKLVERNYETNRIVIKKKGEQNMNEEIWTKEQYLNWVNTRPKNPADWSWDDCVQAERHINAATREKAKNHPVIAALPEPLRKWIDFQIWINIGTVETDEMLRGIDLYPDYLEKGK